VLYAAVFDLSPAVSPSGRKVAMASFQRKAWKGEIEDLQTDIYVMNAERRFERELWIKDGGWPSWASDNVIFFHRKVGETETKAGETKVGGTWGVFRYTRSTNIEVRVTPVKFDAVTPAAISETKVAVATIREKSGFKDDRVEAQYRHIEIFDAAAPGQPWQPVQITQKTRPQGDHYNPFVLDDGGRVGYHRCRSDLLQHGEEVPRNFHKLESPVKDVGLFRVSGVFPTISKDGSKLAFVDNEFSALWLADSQGLRQVFDTDDPDKDGIFAPMWNQNPDKDTLYFCKGASFNARSPLEIYSIRNVSSRPGKSRPLTKGNFNNAFPSSSPDGNKFVFRSTRGGGYKNLYIMEKAAVGEDLDGTVTPLTDGKWTDTHCQWSPNGDWIVFSSTRDKPENKPELDHGLDPGYFAVYLVKWNDPTVVIRVLKSGNDVGGHVNHPVFSPDGRSIAVTADLAAVSAEPISLPLFLHSVRPYGDIFMVDIDTEDIRKNSDVEKFRRITHSRYEYSTPAWTAFATDDPNAQFNVLVKKNTSTPGCPYYPDGGETWQMTGHLCLAKRCC
jgi:hypothetical protein